MQAPAFASVGVIDLETFYPRNERGQLAIALNSLLASPAAGAWTRGEPLDIGRLLYTPEGKPKLSILGGASVVKNVGRVSKQKNDVARAEAELNDLREKWLELAATQIAPRKSDIDIVSFGVLWLPYRSDAGTLVAAFG